MATCHFSVNEKQGRVKKKGKHSIISHIYSLLEMCACVQANPPILILEKFLKILVLLCTEIFRVT